MEANKITFKLSSWFFIVIFILLIIIDIFDIHLTLIAKTDLTVLEIILISFLYYFIDFIFYANRRNIIVTSKGIYLNGFLKSIFIDGSVPSKMFVLNKKTYSFKYSVPLYLPTLVFLGCHDKVQGEMS